MQLAGDAQPLVYATVQLRVEVARDLAQAKLVQTPEHGQKGGRARRVEPRGLVIGRRDGELQCVAGFVPDAAVVRSDHTEAEPARRKIRVKCLSAIAGVLPIVIVALKLVLETDLLRRYQA